MRTKPLPPLSVAPGGRYFETAAGDPFLLIGPNDAISWPGLEGLRDRRDIAGAEAHLADLAAHGVTMLRLMLEYCQEDGWYFEQPAGQPNPTMVRLWDDLFGLCERHGLRVLLAPWDNFWMARRWDRHPYNQRNGGPAASPAAFFSDEATIEATIRRLRFVAERWGGSGVIAAWDLFNEIDPFWGGTAQEQHAVIERISEALRAAEQQRWGWTRLQTLSIFGPAPADAYGDLVFRHPSLDFATTHIYWPGSIDFPADTIAPADAMAGWVRHALSHVPANRPFTDTEHGPIHLFNDHERMLDEDFDDEYERHLMWAHLAGGGAGSGMRWPARHPHLVTAGMKRAYASMAGFSRLLDWRSFASQPAGADLEIPMPGVLAVACRDETQAVAWLVRGAPEGNPPGRLLRQPPLRDLPIRLRGMQAGRYAIQPWDTLRGAPGAGLEARADAGGLAFNLPELAADVALAIRRVGD